MPFYPEIINDIVYHSVVIAMTKNYPPHSSLKMGSSSTMCVGGDIPPSVSGTINNQTRWLTTPQDSSVLHLGLNRENILPTPAQTLRDTLGHTGLTNIMQSSNISSFYCHTLRNSWFLGWQQEIHLHSINSYISPPVYFLPSVMYWK